MKKDDITTLKIPSPDSGTELEVAFLRFAQDQAQKIRFRFPAFAGIIVNHAGYLTLDQGIHTTAILEGTYQLLHTLGGWATITLGAGSHSILFITIPADFLTPFESTYPDAVLDFRNAIVNSKPYRAFTEPRPLPTGMKNIATMLFTMRLPDDQSRTPFLCQLVTSLIMLHLHQVPRKFKLTPPKPPPHTDTVALAAHELLTAQYDRPWTVDLLADTLGVRKRNLAFRFKTAFNTTPMQYLADVRLTTAYKMLMSTDTSIAVVAKRVGYKFSNDFTRAFHKKFGHPPIQAKQRFFPNS
ncbi:AraC family transcriptional regulator [Dawidia soli]|uniref:AraC family transcriptional regulator n=1 Tax=Dawidia soli TaxID=2782352 RepID=A0AAP2DAL7_9BACT|nr:AraC family transcriptional regulator [Dawidia soli]MBT1687105.1 AraC family transcriptional regulator [Dawidia soli]